MFWVFVCCFSEVLTSWKERVMRLLRSDTSYYSTASINHKTLCSSRAHCLTQCSFYMKKGLFLIFRLFFLLFSHRGHLLLLTPPMWTSACVSETSHASSKQQANLGVKRGLFITMRQHFSVWWSTMNSGAGAQNPAALTRLVFIV